MTHSLYTISMYDALVTDLDGTAAPVASDGSEVDRQTKQAIAKATHAGKKLTCATGREWEFAQPLIKALGFTSPCIIEGGTRLIDPNTGDTIWEKDLAGHTIAEVLTIFKTLATEGFVVHSKDISRQHIQEVRVVPDSIRFLYLLAVDAKVAEAIKSTINEDTPAVAHVTPSWHNADLLDIHVTHAQATKEHAIRVWQKLEGVEPATTIGVGDSGNDVPIFRASGLKIAVGNATQELKQLADYIAPAVSDHALEHIIYQKLLHT